MEYLDQDFQANTTNQLEPTRLIRQDWHTTARWANFLAIVWFIFVAIGLLGTLSLGTAMEQLALLGADSPGLELLMSQTTALTIIVLAILAFYSALALFQFRFAKNMRDALQFTNQDALEQSWLQFRNLLRWSGIFVIALIVLYGVLLVFVATSVMGSRG
ncbi:MAG: hypothetical protein IPM98_04160 [Lewinellaceae bacterium]|nr:hypothetical protein [Lewinellaceae bacterium]